jgi:hypothetical protein
LTEDQGRKYIIEKKDNLLIFSTENFQVEKSSVLHSGIYNKEFASILASSVIAGIASIALIMIYQRTVLSYIVFILISIAAFPLFRKFVFRERRMEMAFDLSSGKVEVFLKGLRKKLKESFQVKDISGMVIEKKKEEIVNPDGMAFVEKISLQHGAVIPGFGEEKVLYMLKLKLADGTDRMIYADSCMDDVMSVHGEIKEFLKI